MKLDLGCGANKKEGCVGIDNATESMTGKQFTPDMIADLNLGILSKEYIKNNLLLSKVNELRENMLTQ